jgi:hypothetical protein
VDYTKRTAMQDQLLTKIVQDVANSEGRLEWASPAPAVAIQPVTPDGSSRCQQARHALPKVTEIGTPFATRYSPIPPNYLLLSQRKCDTFLLETKMAVL